MEALDYILKKFNLSYDSRTPMPIEIPNIGRDNLPELLNELGCKIGAEIGVETGLYSERLCKGIPDGKLYSIDAWQHYRGYRDHVDQHKLDGFYETTKKKLAPYNCEVIKGFSMDVVKTIPDHALDYVYIDGNHNFQNITNDLIEWTKKVKIGGIISGHDYAPQKKPSGCHVYEVVNAYTYCYGIRPWFVLGTKEEVPGQIRDTSRSYMWVNLEPLSLKKNQYNTISDELGWR